MLLTKQTIGSTETPQGVYTILSAIARLTAWAGNEYWPTFRKEVLGRDGS